MSQSKEFDEPDINWSNVIREADAAVDEYQQNKQSKKNSTNKDVTELGSISYLSFPQDLSS